MNEFDLVKLLKDKKLHISFAESCTGGMLASTIINVPGASNIINESYVTYASESKIKILGVNRNTIDTYNVVSTNVAYEMVEGLAKISNADICASVTGLAGPSDDGDIKAGTVCFGFYYKNNIETKKEIFSNVDRNEVRRLSVNYAINYLCNMVKKYE